jgi:hypothetical protein
MKKIITICILFVNVTFAQTAEKKVWDLLLSNKREDARKLFDKELKAKMTTNVDYLIFYLKKPYLGYKKQTKFTYRR